MCGVCSLGTIGALALASLAGDEAGALGASTAGSWVPAGEKARWSALSQPLPGGRWVYMNGSGMETVLARSGDSALVRTDSSGAIYELSFDGDGTYLFRWRHASNFMSHNTSSSDERGDWELSGTTLTLKPTSQRALYTNNGLKQEKEDVNLDPRAYQVVDIELETITTAGVEYRTFRGVELSGPVPPWDLASGTLSLDLQRLE